jgi:hypothetical protein
MNYIYINTRDNRQYILNPMITMGEKVCLVDMANCEDKFVSLKTLKRWYSKTITEQPVVELRAFTGMKIGLFRAELATNTNTLYLWTKQNKLLTFDLDMGNQTNAKNPKFANRIHDTYDFLESSLNWVLS